MTVRHGSTNGHALTILHEMAGRHALIDRHEKANEMTDRLDRLEMTRNFGTTDRHEMRNTKEIIGDHEMTVVTNSVDTQKNSGTIDTTSHQKMGRNEDSVAVYSVLPGSAQSPPPNGVLNAQQSFARSKEVENATCEPSQTPPTLTLASQWRKLQNNLNSSSLDTTAQKRLLARIAAVGSQLATALYDHMGNVANALGGTVVSPPVNVSDVQRYFGDIKKFRLINELLEIRSTGVPVKTSSMKADVLKALEYGNHRSAQEHLPQIWEKLMEDVQRDRCLISDKRMADKIEGIRVAPLGVVVSDEVRIINDFSFDPNTPRGAKGGLNKGTIKEEVPRCLCGQALPELLSKITRLRVEYPEGRILLSKADVTDAY